MMKIIELLAVIVSLWGAYSMHPSSFFVGAMSFSNSVLTASTESNFATTLATTVNFGTEHLFLTFDSTEKSEG
jgi:hypothetical protein